MRVFVVAEITGEYSDTCWSVIAAAASLEKAQAIAEEHSRQWHDVKVKEIEKLREKSPGAVQGYPQWTEVVRSWTGEVTVTTNHVGRITAEERWPIPTYTPLDWDEETYGTSPTEWHAESGSYTDVRYEITQTEFHE